MELRMLLLLLLQLQLLQNVAANSPPSMTTCIALNSTYITLSSTDCSNANEINIRVAEEAPTGTPLMQFTATDAESDAVTMTLTGSAQALLHFSLLSFPNNRTAILRSSNRLDAETFPELFTEITLLLDDGKGNQISKKIGIAVIVDVNDNKPEFENMPYRWDIPEDNASSSLSFTVIAVDADRGSSVMSIEFKEVSGSNVDGVFNYSSVTSEVRCSGCRGRRYKRTISLLKPLDYESSRFYQISVNATDLTADGVSSLTDIIINVIDVQDTRPFFEGIPYVRSVAENTPAGTDVLTVVAKDGDRGRPNAVRYELDAGNAFSKYFSLNSSSGQLTIGSTNLDRESAEILNVFGTIDLPVTAKEISTVAQAANISEASTTVRIIFVDANDFRPTFSSSVYNATVMENTQADIPISVSQRITINDLDSSVNGEFNVTVSKNGAAFTDFSVTPVTVERQGIVTVLVQNSSALDYEKVKDIQFQLVAKETRTSERFATTATISLKVIDANDNRPVFNQSKYRFSLNENAPNNTLIGVVQASDQDSGTFGQVTYSIDGTDSDKFRINSTSGEIFVNVNANTNNTLLDRERFPTIFLTLQATDGGGFVTAVQLEIQLLDVNDHSPRFARKGYTAVLRENARAFESEVQIEATDSDQADTANSRITFSITSGDPSTNFAISSATGIVSVVTPLDFESLTGGNTLNLTITASDAGSPVMNSTVQLIVTVIDQNDNSPACSNAVYVGEVVENATFGTRIVQVNASDADAKGSENSAIFFRIQSGAADKFSISGGDGVVAVERGANLDVNRFGSSYNLTIIAFDRGSPQRNGTCSVLITVKDVNNQKPYFTTASRREAISESLAVNSALPVTYLAVDPDSSARLQYSILTAQMRATESNGQQVIDSAYNFTALFKIDPNNGTLFVNAQLDRERAEEILVPLFVRDLASETVIPDQTATGTLIITLIDVNDEAPVFQAPAVNGTYRVTVSESLAPPADISLKAVATDADKTSNNLLYAITPANAFFTIDTATAQVSLKSSLDRETTAQHIFYVTANDTVHVTTATVIVTVSDANDQEPIFYRFDNVTISESTTIGTLITSVAANDSDSGDSGLVNYRIVSGAGTFFTINATSGDVTLLQNLDRDVPGGESYSLVIEAFDSPGSGNSKRTSKTMIVTVSDVNDRQPTFSQANFTITNLQESMEAGTLVKEIPAVDADSGVNKELNFSLQAIAGQSSKALDLFTVATRRSGDSFVAAISTKVSLKNAVGWYNATLLAIDGGSPPLTGSTNLTFFIVDINDFSPEFTYPNASVTVVRVNESTNSTSTVNQELLRASAVDRDFGNNSIIRFSLTSSNGDDAAFRVDAVSGVVTIAARLDREVKSEYRFQIRATDQGIPQLSTQVNIIVEVIDIDESPPIFNQAARNQQMQLAENTDINAVVPGLNITGALVGTIVAARDPDATGSADAVCYFVINRVFDKFYLNKTTGELYSISRFDREINTQFVVQIIAVSASFCNSDKYQWTDAPKSSSLRVRRSLDSNPVTFDPNNAAMTSVTVTVTDVNDNPPKWSQREFFGGVNVNDPPNTPVFTFAPSVSDADAGNNSRITFTISNLEPSTAQLTAQLQDLGILSSVLQVDPQTGILRTGSRTYFQPTMAGSLKLNVTASDGVYAASASCTIFLLSLSQQIVITVNDHTTNVTLMRDTLANYLTNITGWRVVVDNIVTHRLSDGTADVAKTDVYIHAVYPTDNSIVPAVTLRDKIDQQWANIRVLYNQFGVLSVKLAVATTADDTALQITRIALIVVACILTVLLFAACLSLWSCRRMYRRKLKAATAVAFGTNGQAANNMRMPGTNLHSFEGSNPVWMESTYDGLQHDNKGFESDKDSIDNNEIEVLAQHEQHMNQPTPYDEMEKSVIFDNDDVIGSQEYFKGSRDILNSAVDAGPLVLNQFDNGYSPISNNHGHNNGFTVNGASLMQTANV